MSRAEQMVREIFEWARYSPLAQRMIARYAREEHIARSELWAARKTLGIKRRYMEHLIDGSRVLMWVWPKEEK